jgi:acetolactate synthase-1/2/3 large subunit
MSKNSGKMNRRKFLKVVSSVAAFFSMGGLSALARQRAGKPRLLYTGSTVDIKSKQPHGGRLVAHALKREGVRYLFSLCGGHINPIYDGCLDEGIKIIGTRHEQAAAHMAEAWSLVTGQMGVCAVTAGPGLTDAVTGVANAYENRVPMLILGGHSDLNDSDIGSLQDINQINLYESITKWARICHKTDRIPEYIAMAYRHALSGRPGPVYLELPQDILYKKVDKSDVKFPKNYRTLEKPSGSSRALKAAVDIIEQSKRPLIIAGTGCRFSEAGEAIAAFAEHRGIPVITRNGGRGIIPDSHPLSLGPSCGIWGPIGEADTIILLGIRLNFQLGYGKYFSKSVKIIQLDTDSTNIGFNRGADLGIVGDIKLVLEELKGKMPNNPDRQWVRQCKTRVKATENWMHGQTQFGGTPIHPKKLAEDVRDVAGREASYVVDGGWVGMWGGETLPAERPGECLGVLTGPMGTLGVGLPYALAMKMAHPDRTVILFTGDGSFGFTSVEIDTAVRYNIPIVCVVANDQAWGMIKSSQWYHYGPDRLVGVDLGLVRYDKWVEGFGGHGEFVETPGQIKPAIERAIKSGKPACINVLVKTAHHRI